MAGRSAAAQTEKQPDLPLDENNNPVDNSGIELEVEKEPEIEVSVEGEPEPVAAKSEPAQEQPLSALQKQLDELRKSEQLARTNNERAIKERDEAVAQSQKYERESVQSRQDSEQSQLDAINNALVAAKAESASAERELEQAINNADSKAQAEAYRKMARAETNYSRMEDGKSELEYRIKIAQDQKRQEAQRPPPQQQSADPIDDLKLPDRAKEWMREHREHVDTPIKVSRLNTAHLEALDAGIKEFSTAYFAEIERSLGINQQGEPEREPERAAPEPRRTTIVSAPVSREAPSSGSGTSPTRIRLTKEQSDFAKMAGITEKEYAAQLIKLNQYKKNGSYGGEQ